MKYCYLEPPFPKTGYIVGAFLSTPSTLKSLYPMTNFFKDLDEVSFQMMKFADDLKAKSVFRVYNECMAIEVEMTKLFPLERKYWENEKVGSIKYDEISRARSFIQYLRKPAFYEVLVTPYLSRKTKIWDFYSSLPTLLNSSATILEQFMLTSDFPVYSGAKHAAIYKYKGELQFDWMTNQTSAINRKSLELFAL